LGERKYSSYSFTTSALDGGESSASRLGRALTPGKGPTVPIVQEAGWTPEPVWTQKIEERSFAPPWDRTLFARSSSPQSDTILPELNRFLTTIIKPVISLTRRGLNPVYVNVKTNKKFWEELICLLFLHR
jgi:hypothetical protein